MFQSRIAKRARSVVIALAITFAANYVISLSVGTIDHQSTNSPTTYASVSRSGANVPPPPKP